MADKYTSFHELAKHEAHGRDYRVRAVERAHSPVLIVAPHGGTIEVGTSELATLIAGADHSLFLFEGLKAPWGMNRTLHITSHRFDHPDCLALVSRLDVVVGVHGCRGESRIYLGGLDSELNALLAARLWAAGLPAMAEGHQYPGRDPLNICNRGARGRGAQIEVTMDLREAPTRALIASAVRSALADYMPVLFRETA